MFFFEILGDVGQRRGSQFYAKLNRADFHFTHCEVRSCFWVRLWIEVTGGNRGTRRYGVGWRCLSHFGAANQKLASSIPAYAHLHSSSSDLRMFCGPSTHRDLKPPNVLFDERMRPFNHRHRFDGGTAARSSSNASARSARNMKQAK